jgi:pyruvate,water dikinase
MVFPYVEDHNFYVEHWFHSVFWNKVREIGRILARAGFFADASDVFYLNRHELSQALYDLANAWAVGSVPRGPKHWPPIVERRRGWIKAMRRWPAPPALGPRPDAITEPFTTMLLGVTTERIADWLDDDGDRRGPRRGGIARHCRRLGPRHLERTDIAEVEQGRVWFVRPPRRAGRPSSPDQGGGLGRGRHHVPRRRGPRIWAPGGGRHRVRLQTHSTGQRIRVDGDRGVVTIPVSAR